MALKNKKETIKSGANKDEKVVSTTPKIEDRIQAIFKGNPSFSAIYVDDESGEFFTNEAQAKRNFKSFKVHFNK